MTNALEIVEQMFDVIDGHRWADYATACTPDVVMVSPSGPLQSPAEWVQFSRRFARAMPDGRHWITTAVQEGDRVAVQGEWTGTHTGPLTTTDGEVAPTGATVVLRFCAMAELRDARLSRVEIYFDQMQLLAQIGLVPVPPPPEVELPTIRGPEVG